MILILDVRVLVKARGVIAFPEMHGILSRERELRARVFPRQDEVALDERQPVGFLPEEHANGLIVVGRVIDEMAKRGCEFDLMIWR